MSPTVAYAIQTQLLLDQCRNRITDHDNPGPAIAAQQAIDPAPSQPDPNVAMAETMASMSCPEHAVEAYDEPYQRTRPDKRYEILKGRAYNKHCIGAIDGLNEMIALQPNNAQCYTRRGITRGETTDYQGATHEFDKAAEINGLDADLHNQPADAYMHAAFDELDDPKSTQTTLARPANSPKKRSDTSKRRCISDTRHAQAN